jgi:hypothetical protein
MTLSQIFQLLVQLFLLISLLSASITFMNQGLESNQRHKLMYAVSFILFGIILVIYMFQSIPQIKILDNYDIIVDWINISAITTSLSAIGLMIRESKPKIARAPTTLAFLPFLILLVYPFVAETLVLKQILFVLLEVGGGTIACLMYTLHASNDSKYFHVVSALVISLIVIFMNYFMTDGVLLQYLLLTISATLVANIYRKQQLQF